MRVREQYIAEYQHRYEPDKWKNAGPAYFSTHYGVIGRRYCDSYEQAQEALKEVKEYFNGKPRTDTTVCGSIGISSHMDSVSANRLEVVKTRIRVRLVTEWETVEED